MKPKDKIIKVLEEMGFEDIQLFYWNKDGWYLHCTEAKHFLIGYNYKHAIEELIKHGTKYNVLRYDAGMPDYMFDENQQLKEYYKYD